MSKAVYTTRNIGHFGLAFDFYTHFTSPIRRYPDLLIHRLIKAHAGGDPITAQEMQAFDTLALHASEREVAASDAERDSIKMKQVEFLAGRIGEEFDAVISGVTERGMYVEEQTTHADGMIRMKDVGDDYFEYEEKIIVSSAAERRKCSGSATLSAFAYRRPPRRKRTRLYSRRIISVRAEQRVYRGPCKQILRAINAGE